MNRRAFFAALAGAPVAMAAAVASDGLTPNEYLDQVSCSFTSTIEVALGQGSAISEQLARLNATLDVRNGPTRMVLL